MKPPRRAPSGRCVMISCNPVLGLDQDHEAVGIRYQGCNRPTQDGVGKTPWPARGAEFGRYLGQAAELFSR